MELWDAYYQDGTLANRDLVRGEPIPEATSFFSAITESSFFHRAYFIVLSRKRVEHIRFGSADFPLYFADFFLNIRIFLKKIGSSMKKSATSKLLRTIRQINFRLILSDFDEVKC